MHYRKYVEGMLAKQANLPRANLLQQKMLEADCKFERLDATTDLNYIRGLYVKSYVAIAYKDGDDGEATR
jgi:hypothetical protein